MSNYILILREQEPFAVGHYGKAGCRKFGIHGYVCTVLTSCVLLQDTQPDNSVNHSISLIGLEGSAVNWKYEPVCGNRAD